MKTSPDAVCIYIPLMKDLGMSWTDIKSTPRIELEGILTAYAEYSTLHSFDGYSDKDVSQMAKNKPEVRSQYGKYVEANRNLRAKIGKKIQRPSIQDLVS